MKSCSVRKIFYTSTCKKKKSAEYCFVKGKCTSVLYPQDLPRQVESEVEAIYHLILPAFSVRSHSFSWLCIVSVFILFVLRCPSAADKSLKSNNCILESVMDVREGCKVCVLLIFPLLFFFFLLPPPPPPPPPFFFFFYDCYSGLYMYDFSSIMQKKYICVSWYCVSESTFCFLR